MSVLIRRPPSGMGDATGERGRAPAYFGELAPKSAPSPAARLFPVAGRTGIFTTCANPGCCSGWLKLFRSRSTPVFEGGWCCSAACTKAMIDVALRREMGARAAGSETRDHRVPLGLAMLEQGWITGVQLRRALEAQRTAGGGRLGYWLVRGQGVSEQLVTRALGIQWSCPVMSAELHAAEVLATLVPRLFVDAFGALPLRMAAGRILYLGFEDRLDPVLALGVERMTGLRVECGLVAGSAFRPAHAEMLRATYPGVELIEASSETSLAQALARILEGSRPVDSQLVRVHDCFWLRMWLRPQIGPLPAACHVRDVIASSCSHSAQPACELLRTPIQGTAVGE
jgi:Type II secretion system (T2SS), protein E, N-terminal domain